MAATLTVQAAFASHGNAIGKTIFTVALAGVSYATGGITLNLANCLPQGAQFMDLLNVDISSSLGHTCWFVKGATMAASKVQLFVGITEVAAAVSLTLTLSCELSAGRSVYTPSTKATVIG